MRGYVTSRGHTGISFGIFGFLFLYGFMAVVVMVVVWVTLMMAVMITLAFVITWLAIVVIDALDRTFVRFNSHYRARRVRKPLHWTPEIRMWLRDVLHHIY
jgi:hypothetical protein